MNNGTDPGSFINTGFNWYHQGTQIIINKQINSWTLPAGFPNTLGMMWPFHPDNGQATSYLHKNPLTGQDLEPEKMDFYWEDGWELLWMNLGFLPNGDPIKPKNPLAWNTNIEEPKPTNAPYFVLYNRYRGTLRVFFNV